MKKVGQSFVIITAMLLCCGAVSAQRPIKQRLDSIINAKYQKADSLYQRADSLIKTHRVVERIDSILDLKEAKNSFDRRYIRRPKEPWTVKLRLNVAGTSMQAISTNFGTRVKTNLHADLKTTINFAAAYRGISLGLGVNPVKLFKKNSDYELNVNSYGSKFGFDVILQRANSFKGKALIGDEEARLNSGFVHQMAFTTNAYYSFNHKHFSWAAALSQSAEQLKSAGSFIVGASFLAIRTKNDADTEKHLPAMRIYMGHIGVGGGYAHNWVVEKKWLLHASLLPTFVVVNRNNVTIDGTQQKMPYYFPSLISTGRIAIIRYYKHYFAGMTTVVNTRVIGRKDHQQQRYTKWRTRVIFGFRF